MRLGVPELFIVLMVGLLWILPLTAAVWALVTLHRIRTTQEDMRDKLDAMVRAMR